MPGFLRKKPTMDELEQQNETADQEVDLAEKKLLLEKIKRMYGNDAPKKLFGGIRSGISWDEIKFKVGNTDKLKGNF